MVPFRCCEARRYKDLERRNECAFDPMSYKGKLCPASAWTCVRQRNTGEESWCWIFPDPFQDCLSAKCDCFVLLSIYRLLRIATVASSAVCVASVV